MPVVLRLINLLQTRLCQIVKLQNRQLRSVFLNFLTRKDLYLTSGLQYPKTIVEAVDAKNRAIQLAQKAANEVQVAEAKKKIVVAEAIVNASLTPLLLKKQWIEKWSGHLPKVTGNSSTLVGLDK